MVQDEFEYENLSKHQNKEQSQLIGLTTMNDSDDSTAAASRPHRLSGDNRSSTQSAKAAPSVWERLKSFVIGKKPTLREDLQTALQASGANRSIFTEGERIMLANVLKLSDMHIEDVMVPRADIEAVDVDNSLGEALEKLRVAGHSRLPVYDETLDNIIGMVHIKDAMQSLTVPLEKPNGSPIKLHSPALRQKLGNLELVRRVLFVPPSMPVADLLQSMQAVRVHMAIVVDEYGGTDGLVTIEDLLEAVVGEIEDEHDDEDSALVRKEAENIYRADARASLKELQDVIGRDFDPGDSAEDVDTLGGLVFSLIDRVPVRGEVITSMKGFEFEILQADPRRIRRVRIVRPTRTLRTRAKPRIEAPTKS